MAAQGVSAVCFFWASIAFTSQAGRRPGELVRWLGPACALAGFARVNYVLFPSLYSDWIYTGDLLRTASYGVLTVGAAREISRYWAAQAQVAVLDDRRRLARELHDGLVQELVYIRSEAHRLPALHDASPQRIIGACDTALDEARSAIEALGRHPDEPLGFVLHRAARQVAERYGERRILVDLDDSLHVDQRQLHALVRITREAVSNALRHGQARTICIQLSREGAIRRLAVRDDGRGFDAEDLAQSTGYGMTSMRDRAEALPGTFRVDTAPGRGTTVEVTW
jgi:signal transduction histidine kinase